MSGQTQYNALNNISVENWRWASKKDVLVGWCSGLGGRLSVNFISQRWGCLAPEGTSLALPATGLLIVKLATNVREGSRRPRIQKNNTPTHPW